MTTHPLDSLADQLGDRAAAVVLAVATAGPLLLIPASVAPLWVGLGAIVYATSDGLDLSDDGETELEHAQRRYRRGDISLQEFEERLEIILDDQAQEIRGLAETVKGVGPERSASVAHHYRTVREFRRASESDLREIHDIGPQLAEKLASEIGPYGGDESDVPDSTRATASTSGDPLTPDGGRQ